MPTGTMNQKFAYFLKLCKENLHMIICMSPVGEALRTRIRTFPGLVNCTTIDWFLPWPTEALISTAETSLKDLDVKANNPAEAECIKEGIVKICVDM
jgi:dynein heavy chain